MSYTLRRGLNEESGSWKIICESAAHEPHLGARQRAQILAPRSRSSPSPAFAGRQQAQDARPIVVLPLPDSPTSPRVSPVATSNETPATAWKVRPPRRKVTR